MSTTTTQDPFRERIQHGPILCDGAMGTQLYSRGIAYDRCFEELNTSDPELIKTIHLEYIQAGAEIIETNTFGANRYRLLEHSLGDRVQEINRAGARIARDARDLSERPIFIAGNIGPLGVNLAPLGDVLPEQARAAFREQTEALLQAGVDLFMIETISDLAEMREAIGAVRDVTTLPIVAMMTFSEEASVASGEDPRTVARVMHDLGADIVGVNCALGPSSTLDIIQTMQEDTDVTIRVAAEPNAGLPRRVGNRFIYVSTPDYFADYTRRFVDANVCLIGGCCGTTPQHIAAMRKAIDECTPELHAENADVLNSQSQVLQLIQLNEYEKDETTPEQPNSKLAQLLHDGRFVVSVEMRPPRSVKYTRFVQNAAYLRDIGVDLINITDNAMARIRMNNIAAAQLIQQGTGLETIVHFTPRDRNLMAVQSDIIGAHALNIHNILAVTGDPPSHGDFPHATGIWDVDSIGLIAILNNLNQGMDGRGDKLAAASSFFIGCAATPTATDIDLDIERLHRKLEAGAQYIMTQPVYDPETFFHYFDLYKERFGPLHTPILVGLQPLHSYQQAEKFHNEVPGIVIPEHIRQRLHAAGEDSGRVGIEIALEMFEAVVPYIQGTYIMPLDRYTLIGDILPTIRERIQASIMVNE
ncbi:bifunctional homocysteine S-methyltransferase/methylenetetrahydrofolate reductase [Ktedonobacteria bacterium brp13]|nr:bifunctional homocysteine S-methyltransferase/methylenetetrahydrofolate reductase [Ktedonobacteria bacterium brp13]